MFKDMFTGTAAIFRREFAAYFATPLAYVFIVIFLVFSGIFTFYLGGFFERGQADLQPFFTFLPWLYLFLVPAVTMRLWAEERKSGTLELLLTMPLRETEVVLGKFLASFGFLALTLAFTVTVPLSIGLLGRPDWGVIAGSYAGVLFLGAAYLAIGLWISSLTESQVVAFIISVAMIFLLLAAGVAPQWLGSVGWFAALCEYLSLFSHFQNILRGVLDSRDVVYYVIVVCFFLYLNVKNIEARKWR